MFAVIIDNEQGFLFCRQWPLVPSLMMSTNKQRWSPYLPVLMNNNVRRIYPVLMNRGATLERCRHVVKELSCAGGVLYTVTSQLMNKGVHVQIFCFWCIWASAPDLKRFMSEGAYTQSFWQQNLNCSLWAYNKDSEVQLMSSHNIIALPVYRTIWAYLFGILFKSFFIFIPNFSFLFFPILISEENVFNTLQQCRPLFFGGFPNPPRRKKKLGIPQKKLGISQEEVGDPVCPRTSKSWDCFERICNTRLKRTHRVFSHV